MKIFKQKCVKAQITLIGNINSCKKIIFVTTWPVVEDSVVASAPPGSDMENVVLSPRPDNRSKESSTIF